jgi:peptidoglycan/LPS O-acetylase OafA/YrhL
MVIACHSTLLYRVAGADASGTGIAGGLLRLTAYGQFGVTLFFVISGYCICAAADSARWRDGRVRTFFLRRFRRIYPPLWLVMVALVGFFVVVDYVLWPGLLSSAPWKQPRPWRFSPSQVVGNLTLTETWRHYAWGSPRGHFPGQAWTLCYEEQFYAVTGLLLLANPRRFYPGAIAVTVAAAAVQMASSLLGVPVIGFFFDGSWFLFAVGMLVFFVLRHHRDWTRWLTSLLIIASALAWWLESLNLSVALAFGALLLILHPLDRRLTATRPVAALMWCGTMCYSLYLVHQSPVKAITAGLLAFGYRSPSDALLISVPLCTATSLVLGRLFFLGVERRFLNGPAEQPVASSLDLPAGRADVCVEAMP